MLYQRGFSGSVGPGQKNKFSGKDPGADIMNPCTVEKCMG
jgi:hypothetical protein